MSPNLINNVLSWASDIEPDTMTQAQRVAALPFVQKPLALMPDAHLGAGATIGSVIATEGAVIPAAVGVDLGCGMLGAHFDLKASALPDDLGSLLSLFEQVIPAGVGQGHADTYSAMVNVEKQLGWTATLDADRGLKSKAITQCGSLGSGNHFVEVCIDQNDDVWLVLHSGSRGVGNKLAQRHIAGAKGLMKELGIRLEDPDLAYLTEGDPAFQAYIVDMLWAQDYAALNRTVMMTNALTAFEKVMGGAVPVVERINTHHNFTQQETHRGRLLWITRKGAVKADVGDRGIIPGSMGTSTFIVDGLGNPDSYNSSSHGAGRRMSRNEAKRLYGGADLAEMMQGKVWRSDHAADLVDEIPSSYKDIHQVMADQADLVRVTHTLTQVLNFKGL